MLTNMFASRRRQIDTLKAFNENVSELQKDVEYKVEFNVNSCMMTLFITLPSEFPKEKPQVQVQPPVLHPWVANGCEVNGAPGLLNYSMHSDLGRIVSAVIREFQVRPPQILQTATTQTIVMGDPELALSNASVDILTELQTNSEKLEEFVRNLPQWKNISSVIEARISEVEEIAQENLNREAELNDLQKKVLKQISQAEEKKLEFDVKQQEYLLLGQKFQPESIQAQLKAAARESQIEADDIAERFLNAEIDADKFLLDYMEKRKLSQLRKTKEEKLDSQLRELHRAGF